MKTFFSFLLLVLSLQLSAQETKLMCNELPFADPEVRASCLTEDVIGAFKGVLTEKLKKEIILPYSNSLSLAMVS